MDAARVLQIAELSSLSFVQSCFQLFSCVIHKTWCLFYSADVTGVIKEDIACDTSPFRHTAARSQQGVHFYCRFTRYFVFSAIPHLSCVGSVIILVIVLTTTSEGEETVSPVNQDTRWLCQLKLPVANW